MLLRGVRLFLSSWRRGLRRRRAWTVCALGLIVAVEVLGRLAHNDVADLGWIATVVLFLAFVGAAHRADPIPWWGLICRASAGIAAMAKRTLGELGVDFRGTPPYPLGLPPLLARGLPALLGSIALMAALRLDVCGGLRWLGVHGSFSVYLLLLGAIWFLHGTVLVSIGSVLLGLSREFSRSGRRGPDGPPARFRVWCARTLLVATVLCIVAVPHWVALVVIAACPLVHGLVSLLPGRPTLALLFIPRSGGSPRRVPWELFVWLQHTFVLVFTLTVVLMSRGVDLWGVGHTAGFMPFSTLFGGVTAWVGAGGSVALTAYAVHVAFVARRRNTEAPATIGLRLAGAPSPADLRAVSRGAALEGFAVRAPNARARRGDVEARLVDSFDPFDEGTTVGRDGLDDPATRERLVRRNAVVQRRLLLRAIERVLKRARRNTYQRGTGYLLAPQVWFVSGLLRDEDEDTPPDDKDRGTLDGRIGPRWDRLLPLVTRRHAFEVLGALEVDVLYVEDGVPWRRLRLVFKRLFELYDRHQGERRAEDARFTGIPGVRVVVDEVAPEEPFRLSGYPEPHYSGLGRARVLHVFKDRGGEEQLTPDDAPSELVPLLV